MRTSGWQLFGGGHEPTIIQLASLMANAITGDHDSQIVNFFATPLFGDREDLAYLQGSRAIKSLQLGPLGIRQLERQFKEALSVRGLSGLEGDIHVARFRVYYWSMVICLTNGTQRRLARKKVKKSKLVVEKLTDQTGDRRILSR